MSDESFGGLSCAIKVVPDPRGVPRRYGDACGDILKQMGLLKAGQSANIDEDFARTISQGLLR